MSPIRGPFERTQIGAYKSLCHLLFVNHTDGLDIKVIYI